MSGRVPVTGVTLTFLERFGRLVAAVIGQIREESNTWPQRCGRSLLWSEKQQKGLCLRGNVIAPTKTRHEMAGSLGTGSDLGFTFLTFTV